MISAWKSIVVVCKLGPVLVPISVMASLCLEGSEMGSVGL